MTVTPTKKAPTLVPDDQAEDQDSQLFDVFSKGPLGNTQPQFLSQNSRSSPTKGIFTN